MSHQTKDSIRILIVDDSTNLRSVIERYLKMGNIDAQYFQAGNGEEALQVLQEQYVHEEPITVVFLDWMMPKMNGQQFIQNLKSTEIFKNDPKIIMLTAETYAHQVETILTYGISSYVTKPFTQEKLIEALKKALSEEDLPMPFEVLNQNEYLLVKLTTECQGDEEPGLLATFKEQMEKTGLKNTIVQCSECSFVGIAFLRQLSQVYKEVKSKNGLLRLVSANKNIQELIRNNGLDRILVNKMSLRGAMVDLGLVKQKDFDVNFINPFLNSTQKVLKIQCFLEAKPQKAYLKKPTDPLLLGDVSGIISVTSETWTGTLAISLSEAIFSKIVTNMLGEPCDKISEENVDIVGELANIILGQAKVELATLGYQVQMALPSCVWGKDHKIKHFGAGVCVVIPFETEHGTIHTEIMTSNNLIAQAIKATKAA